VSEGNGADHGETQGVEPLAPAVGANLRRLRMKRGLSLERLARRAGVSRAMLSQIELGHSAPTINLLWKVARALDVTFASLVTQRNDTATVVMPAREARLLTNQGGTFTSRALFPLGERKRTEFYELRLKADGEEIAHPHTPGTVESLVVASGAVDLDVAGATHRLGVGDAIQFSADVMHSYRNASSADAVMYLVMTYANDPP
jgi:transcriptional regulator with XRE-family HTH domain